MPKEPTKEWFERMVKREGDADPSTGVNGVPFAEYERLAFDTLPPWARKIIAAADNIRKAQREYMEDRGNEAKGRAVADATYAYDKIRGVS